jgi:hypothetical protein
VKAPGAVELEQAEGIEDHLTIVGTAVQLVEDRDAGTVAIDRLPIDHDRLRRDRGHRLRRSADNVRSSRIPGG